MRSVVQHRWTSIVVDGFASGEVDFAARLAADQSVRDRLDEQIIGPLVNAVNDGAVLLIRGHSDRVDTGEDHRTCLDRERAASEARARSAYASVLTIIRRDWLPALTDWSDLPYLGVQVTWSGAVGLGADPVDEASRLKNRRVTMDLCCLIGDE